MMRDSESTTMATPLPQSAAHYFVDEAGDGVIFNARGQVIIGTEGCSRNFIIGALQVSSPETLEADLNALRARLLADPYFRGVESMRPERRKTALAFHAKDDVAEVRREVFSVLLRHEIKFFAVVRRMESVLTYVQHRNQRDDRYRYRPNELYDKTVSRLFRDRLHVADECNIVFAKRGSSDRTRAFRDMLELGKTRFEDKWQRKVESTLNVVASTPQRTVCLQAVDYMLWALQRFYERGEDRFLQLMWPKVSLVHAVDETTDAPYGVYYTKKNPPFEAALRDGAVGA
jgi:Protein of unknown function (DUF3800)